MPVMTMESDQPTAREILDAVLHSQDLLAGAIRRVEDDVHALRKELTGDVLRLERRVVRIDDRLSSVEDLRLLSVLDDHERRIGRLEGF
jgi:hypothetical protein